MHLKIIFIKTKLILLLIYTLSIPLLADWNGEKLKIDYLLEEIEKIDGVFIRNGKEYSPTEAVSHLLMKLKNAQSSWFSPPKEKWTAEMFIKKIASGSSISGKPYLVKFKNGKTMKSAHWLTNKLKNFKGK